MAKIKIVKGPFKVRFKTGQDLTEAAKGETLELTPEEMKHWYTKGELDAGRAVKVEEDSEDAEEEPGNSPETELHLVQRSELEATETKLATETQARERAEDELAQEVTAHNETKGKLADAEAKLAALEAHLQGGGNSALVQEQEDLDSRMLAVFSKLTDDDYKTDGTPKVKSVETLLGENVTADQVAAAWAKFQAGQE